MKKSDRITTFVSELGADPDLEHDPCYQGYFKCFNRQHYYEAHDVLEHLWLKEKGQNHLYFKGLIQVAGAFVHLQKQHVHPTHPKHGKRLRPAVRLFRLGMKNLEAYRPTHMHFDVESLWGLCARLSDEIEASGFEKNPWSPNSAPTIHLGSQS